MTHALIAIWTACIVAQAVLICLTRRKYRRRCPVFFSFLCYDFLRWLGMYGIWLWGTRQQYAVGFLWTEPGSMILLCASGIESFGQLVNERPPRAAYATIISAVLAMGFVLPAHPSIPLTRMFTERALMAATPILLLLVAGAWHSRMPDAHGIILAVFCLFDLVTYMSLALYPGWAKTRPIDGPLFVMSGQLCCLVAWCFHARRFHDSIQN